MFRLQELARSENRFVLGVRWLLVVPSGLFIAALISFPVHWAILIGKYIWETNPERTLGLWVLPADTIERFASAFVAPWALVYFGARMAPAFKLHVGFGLLLLYVLAFGALLTYSVVVIGAYGDWLWLELAGVILLGLGGGLKGLHSAWRNVQDTRQSGRL